jgi:glycosyltransferase involved in cell wall biosynthesis
MNVLIWSQYFWPENFRINQLATALHQSGLQVSVLTGKPNYPEGNVYPGYKTKGIQVEGYEGMRVIRMPLVSRGNNSFIRLALNYLSFILSGYMFAPKALRSQKIDVVFVYAVSPLLQTLPAILIAKIKRAPLVLWVQDLWPESLLATGFVKNRYILQAVEKLVRYIYRHTDSILISSEAFRGPISRLVKDVDKIRYYPNAAEPVAVRSGSKNACLSAVEIEKWFSIVFAGNIGAAQSMETILGAAEKLRSFQKIKIFIVGSGSQKGWLEKEMIKRKLDNVRSTGRLPHTEMPEIFAAASVLLVTLKNSPIFTFTVPSKVQAYLAAGKPVIASMNGEGARIIEAAGAGFSCPAEDSNALAKTILSIYNLSAEEQIKPGERGLRYFKDHFNFTSLVAELIDHFKATRAVWERNKAK